MGGLRQSYQDSWYENMTIPQRTVRILLAAGEASAIDQFSGFVGNQGAKLGTLVGGPLGAVGGKLFGNTIGTNLGDAFFSNVVNPWVSNETPLGVFP